MVRNCRRIRTGLSYLNQMLQKTYNEVNWAVRRRIIIWSNIADKNLHKYWNTLCDVLATSTYNRLTIGSFHRSSSHKIHSARIFNGINTWSKTCFPSAQSQFFICLMISWTRHVIGSMKWRFQYKTSSM